MLKPTYLDLIVSPTDRFSSFVSEHKTFLAIVAAAVIIAIVLIVVLIKKSHKKGV
jgi:hypothetical protein